MKKNGGWLNPTVLGASLTSLLSDFGHESVTSLLPAFLASIGAPAYALGLIEGASDALSSFAKLFSGYYSDRTGKRREIAVLGYLATGLFPAIVAIATVWPVVLVAKVFAWIGRGSRSPPRDAIIAEAVGKEDYGKAFGFERMGDTLGAVLGPALAYFLLAYIGIREIIWLAVVPGTLAAVVFWVMVREKNPNPSESRKDIIVSLKGLSRRYKEFLYAVFLFGMADFSHTLLIFFAVSQLAPEMGFAGATSAAILLYVLHNIVYALACYPFGVLGDMFGRRKVLAASYGIAVLTFIGFIVAPVGMAPYALLFSLAGIFVAAEDTLERAVGGELVGKKDRALGYGALASMNGVGDFISSAAVGVLWAFFGFTAGFAFSAVLGAAGTLALIGMNHRNGE
ncbi:MAG: MFS transporter [Candidatus Micrarchaeota archaeon]